MAETKTETKPETKDALVAFVTPLLRAGESIADYPRDDKGKVIGPPFTALVTSMGRRFEKRGDTFMVTSGLPKGAHNEMAWTGKAWIDGAGATITL